MHEWSSSAQVPLSAGSSVGVSASLAACLPSTWFCMAVYQLHGSFGFSSAITCWGTHFCSSRAPPSDQSITLVCSSRKQTCAAAFVQSGRHALQYHAQHRPEEGTQRRMVRNRVRQGGKVAHGLLACVLQLLLELHGSFSSWASEVVGQEQVIQQQLGSQQKVRLHSNSARRPRRLLASQQSVHLITAVTGLCYAPMWESRSSCCVL